MSLRETQSIVIIHFAFSTIYSTITNIDIESDSQGTEYSIDTARTDSTVPSPSSSDSSVTSDPFESISPSLRSNTNIAESNPTQLAPHRKRKSTTDEDDERSKRLKLLTEFVTKEPGEIETYCSSLACTLKKFPEYIQAELKLTINTIVGNKEIEFLKAGGNNSSNNHHSAPTNIYNSGYSDNQNQIYTNDSYSIEGDRFTSGTVIVDSVYGGYSTMSRL